MPAHASGFPAIFEFSVVFAVIPKGCLQVALVVAGIYNIGDEDKLDLFIREVALSLVIIYERFS